jgi:hypothetical protein
VTGLAGDNRACLHQAGTVAETERFAQATGDTDLMCGVRVNFTDDGVLRYNRTEGVQ